jgi:hypothetical protein
MEINNKVIGILGTAKNTGKTTTFNFLLEWSNLESIKVGLTSIGYDGEDIDNITGLPKPRIFVQKDNTIATAEQCLFSLEDKIKTIEKTDVHTALGRVVIGKARKEGLVVLAGPNKGIELQVIIQKLKQQKTEIILVDGALNRMIPLIYCDALILTTGASRHTDIDLLVDEIESMSRVFTLPLRKHKQVSNEELKMYQNNIVIIQNKRNSILLKGHSLINQKTFDSLINIIGNQECEEIYIPGIISDTVLKKIINKYYLLFQGKTIIINNPAFLLVGSRYIGYLKDIIDDILSRGIKLKTLYKLPILAVTINPFYPKYSRFGKDSYEAAYIDEEQLYQKMKKEVPFPVINIKGEGSTKLEMIIKKFLNISIRKNA